MMNLEEVSIKYCIKDYRLMRAYELNDVKHYFLGVFHKKNVNIQDLSTDGKIKINKTELKGYSPLSEIEDYFLKKIEMEKN